VDSQIKHEGDDISSFVISYDRDHKICTGIGKLTVVVSKTIPRTFNPWDSIDIHEGGGFKCKYFVSNVSVDSPQGTITIDAQDNSKRLTDYFIPDSYTVEVPSYSRYWIEKFLTEAGVDFIFTTTSQGNLLSNFTNLGLTQAYEQILNLLQMSGWFMYFDGDGKANIGKLDKELSSVDARYGKEQILSIVVKKDDKMLRNRALVLGNYDPLLAQQIIADVSVQTKWNYDENDLRTVVISNTNIPNNSSAFGIANQLLKEFSTITVEKHISIAGAKNLTVGDVVGITTGVYAGKGLVTTFGTSMSASGLITNLILDERCPRLFGFFNFGDYVYVATFGDGIWRKHIQYLPDWENFSDGLDELRITDLHINHDIFSAVGASGQMYYNLANDTPWSMITMSGLYSYADDEPETLFSGITMSGYVPFSGIMARATIVDKTLGRFIYGVDTYSSENTGDYFLTLSGIYTTTLSGYYDVDFSGILISGEFDMRGWIVEYNILSGFDTYNSYPISIENNYRIRVLDLENDGSHDYVSVMTIASGILDDGELLDYSSKTSQPSWTTRDDNDAFYIPIRKEFYEDDTKAFTLSAAGERAICIVDNEKEEVREVVVVTSAGFFKKLVITIDEFLVVDNDVITSPDSVGGDVSSSSILAVVNSFSRYKYKVFYFKQSLKVFRICYKEWDSYLNTLSPEHVIKTVNFLNEFPTALNYHEVFVFTNTAINSVCIENKIYLIVNAYRAYDSGSVFAPMGPTYSDIVQFTIDTTTNSATRKTIFEHQTNQVSEGFPDYYGYNTSPSFGANIPLIWAYKNGKDVKYLGFFNQIYLKGIPDEGPPKDCKFSTVVGNSAGIDDQIFQEGISGEDGAHRQYDYLRDDRVTPELPEEIDNAGVFLLRFGSCQLTSSKSMIGFKYTNTQTGNKGYYTFNGEEFKKFEVSSYSEIPFQKLMNNITPILGNVIGGGDDIRYIAKDPMTGTLSLCDANTLEIVEEIILPNAFVGETLSLLNIFSTGMRGYAKSIYFLFYYSDGFESWKKLIPYDLSVFRLDQEVIIPFSSTMVGPTLGFGNFIISMSSGAFIGIQASCRFVNFGSMEYSGASFLVLQREGVDFNVIQRAGLPIRLDISNYAPLLTVQDTEVTFNSFFITNSGEVTQISNRPTISGFMQDDGTVGVTGILMDDVTDYRYSMLTGSGELGIERKGVYIKSDDIYSMNIETLSGWIVLYENVSSSGVIFDVDVETSGLLNLGRIETTNYAASGQYIFVTTSGDFPQFYQKDALSDIFVLYSGLPQSRATIIRVDDML
jgi:hypothetical protein